MQQPPPRPPSPPRCLKVCCVAGVHREGLANVTVAFPDLGYALNPGLAPLKFKFVAPPRLHSIEPSAIWLKTAPNYEYTTRLLDCYCYTARLLDCYTAILLYCYIAILLYGTRTGPCSITAASQ